jgi:hypothetical protein
VVGFDTPDTPFISGHADAPGKGWEHGELPYILHEVDSYLIPVSEFHEWTFCGVTAQVFDGCVHVFVRDATMVAPTAILPAFWTVRFIRWAKRAREPGRCPKCGYDLTGNTSGVCPECGTMLAPPEEAEA